MKQMKRILSFIMAFVLAGSSFAIPAFATSGVPEETPAEAAYYHETVETEDDLQAVSEALDNSPEAAVPAADTGAAISADSADNTEGISVSADTGIAGSLETGISEISSAITSVYSDTSMAAGSDAAITESARTDAAQAGTEIITEAAVPAEAEESKQEFETDYVKLRLFTPGSDTETVYKLKKAEQLTEEDLNNYLREYQADEQTLLEAYFFEPYPENNENNHVELIINNTEKTRELEKIFVYLIDRSGKVIKYVGEFYRSENFIFEIEEDNSGKLKKAEFDFTQVTDRYGNIYQPGGFAIAKTKELAAEQQTLESPDDTASVTGGLSKDTSVEVNAAASEDPGDSAPASSIISIMGTILSKTIDASDGNTYRIEATYGASAGIPMKGTSLNVSEMDVLDEEYVKYLNDTAEALGVTAGELGYLRVFDISIIGEDGTEYEPGDQVEITVELMDDSGTGDLRVVHFGEETEEIAAETEGNTVTFTTESFSIFSFVDLTIIQNAVDAVFGRTYKDKIYENDDIIISGRMPRTAIVEANPAEIEVDGADILVAYDIKIYAGAITKALGIAWQPTEGALTVRMKSDTIGNAYADVFHVDDEGNIEQVGDTIEVADHTVVFDAESFSVYAVSAEPRKTFEFYKSNMSEPYYFKLDDSATDQTYKQFIKNGDSLIMPQLPEEEGKTFLGWYIFDKTTSTDTGVQQAFDEEITVTSDEVITLYAKFGITSVVSFHAAKDNSGIWPTAFSKLAIIEDDTARVEISDVTVSPVSDLDVFVGWTDTPEHALAANNTDYVLGSYNDHTYTGGELNAVTANNGVTAISVSNTNISLYPVFAHAHWIHYSSGEAGNGSDYQAPQYVLTGNTVSRLPVIGRTGYTFAGWYDSGDQSDHMNGIGTQVTDASGRIIANLSVNGASSDASGNMTLSSDLELYAKWIPDPDTPYHVVYWVQQSTDAAGLPDANKKYDYIKMTVRTAATGSTVSLTTADRSVTQVGSGATGDMYVFNGVLSTLSTTVAADGSTVLNVYFDRKPVTLTFQVQSGSRWNTVHTVTELYGHNIAYIFNEAPLGTTYSGYVWEDADKTVYQEVLSTIELMPAKSVTFHGRSRETVKTIYYYFESLDQDSPAGENRRMFNGKYYDLHKTVLHNYNFLTYDEEFYPIDGFLRDRSYAEPYFGQPGRSAANNGGIITNTNRAPIGGYTTNVDTSTIRNKNYLYYQRDSFMLEFRNGHNNDLISSREVLFEDTVSAIDDPDDIYAPLQNAGYYFTGWYADSACGTRVFFTDEEAEQKKEETRDDDGNYHYMVISAMPNKTLTLYAGWQQQKFPVTIDPDGGALSATEATYFNANYGEPILEYTDVTRPFAEVEEGQDTTGQTIYYYYYDTKELNQATGNTTRRAYYYPASEGVKAQTRLDANGNPVQYIENNNMYSLVGWYRLVNGKLELFDFTTGTTEATTLQAVWRKSGIWKVEFDAGSNGTIDGTDNAQSIILPQNFADGSMIVLDKIAVPNTDGTNLQFIGWRIEGDTTNTVYYPNESLVYRSQFANKAADGSSTKNMITLVAVYSSIVTTSLTFDANGGTGTLTDMESVVKQEGTEQTVSGNTISKIEINDTITLSSGNGFTRDGYKFIGWSTYSGRTSDDFAPGSNSTDFYPGEVVIVDNHTTNTLYAVWEELYTVRFDPNGGAGTLTDLSATPETEQEVDGNRIQNIRKNEQITISSGAGFSRDGYEFVGWNTASDGSGTSYAPGSTSAITANLTLYAQWVEKYRITYDRNGGQGILTADSGMPSLTNNGNGTFSTAKLYRDENAALNSGTGLSRDGYVFDGWTDAPDGTTVYTTYSVAQADVTVYAKWTRLLSVTYRANGGNGTLTSGGSAADGGSTTVLTPVDGIVSGIRSGSVLSLSDGTGFVRSGYTLIGWNEDQAAATAGTVQYAKAASYGTLTDDMTLYAVWQKNLHINYHANGGTGSLTGLASLGSGIFSTGDIYTVNQSAALHNGNTITRDGYKLIGWSTDSDCTSADFDVTNTTDFALSGSMTISADTDLYAVWAPLLTITYDPNEGLGELTDGGSYTVSGGSAVSLTPESNIVSGIPENSDVTLSDGDGFIRYGYELNGWNTKADGTGTAYALGGNLSEIQEDTTLYAQWQKIWSVNFNTQEGTWDARNTGYTEITAGKVYRISVTDGSTVSAPAYIPSHSTMVFDHWSASADDSTGAYNFNTAVTGNLTLYAQYTEVSDIKVTFDVNGGNWNSGNSSTYYVPTSGNYEATIDAGSTVNEPVAPTKNNRIFVGWVTDEVLSYLGKTKTVTNWSNTTNGKTGGNTGYVNDLAYIKANLFDFSKSVLEDVALHAIWSETVRVNYNLLCWIYDGLFINTEHYHSWTESENANYLNNGDNKYCIIAKGDLAPFPNDPTANTEGLAGSGLGGSNVKNATFRYWVTNDSYKNSTNEPNSNYIYNFLTPVTSEITLYTSWIRNNQDRTIIIKKSYIGDTEKSFDFTAVATVSGKQVLNTTFTLKHNETEEITLPADAVLTVVETTTGYTAKSEVTSGNIPLFTKNSNGFTLTVPDNNSNKVVTVTNTRKTKVTITKVYKGDNNLAFEFTASATDDGKAYSLESDDARFTLKNGDSKTITLPVGVILTVAETSGDYNMSSAVVTDGTVNSFAKIGNSFVMTVPDGDSIITVTNTKEGVTPPSGDKGNVKITKNVEDPLNAGDTFSFTAVFRNASNELLPNQAIKVKVGNEEEAADTTTNADGEYQFTLTGGSSLIFEDLPVGWIVTVMENGAAEYTTSASGIPGGLSSGKTYIFEVPAGDSEAVFTNTRREVPVNVNKIIENGTSADGETVFQFTANIKFNNVDVEYNDNGFNDGSKAFTITGEGSATLTVPAGATLEIEEILQDTNRYEVRAAGISGGSFSGNTYTFTVPTAGGTAIFTNTRKTVNVTVAKILENVLKTGDEIFDFTAVLKDGGIAVEGYPINGANMTQADGVYSYVFGENSPAVLTIPYGSTLQVTETVTSGFTTEYSTGRSYTSGSSYTFTNQKSDAAITFRNTLGTQTVTVYKTVVDPLGSSRSFSFTGYVTNVGGAPVRSWDTQEGTVTTETGGLITDNDGRITFSLAGNGTGQPLILPLGAKLVVSETDADLYTTTVTETDESDNTTVNGSASNANKTYTMIVPSVARKITFTNKMPYRKVTIQKVLDDPAANGDESFNFTVSAAGVDGTALSLPGSWNYDDDGTLRTSMLSDSTFTLEKKGSGYASKEIWLPVGSGVVITETSVSHGSGTPENVSINYDMTVTRQVGSGSAESVAGASQDYLSDDTIFTFTNTRKQVPVTILKVDDEGNNLNGATFTSDNTFPEGSLSTNGSSTVFAGKLYTDVTYTLTETVVPTHYAGPSGSIAIRIRNGEVSFPGMQPGDASYTYDESTGRYTIRIRNTRQISLVKVSKTVNDPIADGTEKFAFTAAITESDGRPISGYPIHGESGTTNDNGELSFEIAGGENIILSVPYGMNLTIREDLGEDANSYNTTASGDGTYNSGTRTVTLQGISSENANVTFTNYRKTTRVYVYKTLEDILSSDDKTFSFTATVMKADGTTPLKNYAVDGNNTTDEDGKYSFNISLKHGETKDIYLVVPVGAKVAVEENLTKEERDIYTSSVTLDGTEGGTWTGNSLSTAAFEAMPDQNTTVQFVNSRKTAILTVTKTVSGDMGDRTQKFQFTLSGLVPGVEYTFSAARVSLLQEADADGKITFELAHDDYMTIELPIGTDQNYTVTETQVPYYTTTVDGKEGLSKTIENFATDTTVSFVNDHPAVAPTGWRFDLRPFALLLGIGAAFALIFAFGRKRRREEE